MTLRTLVPAATLLCALLAGCSLPLSPSISSPTVLPPSDCADISPGTPLPPRQPPRIPTNTAYYPEQASGYRTGMSPVTTHTTQVVTANPLASHAACLTLLRGGTAADALVVAQTVLGLTEPQSSGIGGGAYLLYYDAQSRSIQAYDGRETAPDHATGDYLRWINPEDRQLPHPTARASGRSIGVPGVLRLLEDTHREHGSLPWASLFEPAIALADHGFALSHRMAAVLAPEAENLLRDAPSRNYLLHSDGSPRKEGEILTNPAYAKTLSALSTDGADVFYRGFLAEDIVEAVGRTSGGRTAGAMTLQDLAQYSVRKYPPVCIPYRNHQVCGMPGSTSGGITVAQILGILSYSDLASLPPSSLTFDGGLPDPHAVHLIAEAERLAYADRDTYLADPDFVAPPQGNISSLLNPAYLETRFRTIQPEHSMGVATAGQLGPVTFSQAPGHEHGTSHISIVDSHGNAASMTTSVESAFGSYHFVDGFFLNNQLTDFSAQPQDSHGNPIANTVQPGKRPRSSMSPTLVLASPSTPGSSGELEYVLGSPGGGTIIQFIVKTLVSLLDWGLDPQQAVGMVNFGATNTEVTSVGGEHPLIQYAHDGESDPLVRTLREWGHSVSVAPQDSGLSVIRRLPAPHSPENAHWQGGADPRREGVVMGDHEHVS